MANSVHLAERDIHRTGSLPTRRTRDPFHSCHKAFQLSIHPSTYRRLNKLYQARRGLRQTPPAHYTVSQRVRQFELQILEMRTLDQNFKVLPTLNHFKPRVDAKFIKGQRVVNPLQRVDHVNAHIRH